MPTPMIDDDFARATTAAGTVTGPAGGHYAAPSTGQAYIDLLGGTWNISASGNLSNWSTGTGGVNPPENSLLRPAGENFTDGQGRAWFTTGATAGGGISFRVNGSGGGTTGYWIGMYSAALYFFKNAATNVSNFATGISNGTAVCLQLDVSGNSYIATLYAAADTTFSTPLFTHPFTDDDNLTAGQWGVSGYDRADFSHFQLTPAAGATFTLSPTTAVASTPETVTATGTGTAWVSGTTTFSVSGGTGASISALSINNGTQVATFTLNPGSTSGTLTISDSADAATATIAVSNPSLQAGAATSLFVGKTVAYMSAAAPTGGTGPYTYQWEISSNGGTSYANAAGTGTTTLTPRITGLTAATAYLLRCRQTDSAGSPAVVTTNAVSFTTLATTDHIYGLVADSIGVGALDAGGVANPNALGTMLAALRTAGHNCDGDDEAISGTDSGQWLPGSGNLNNAIASFVAHEVTDVLYMLGTNDSKTTTATSAATYDANMRATIAELLNGHGISKVIIEQSPYPIPGTLGATWDSTSLTSLLSYQVKQAAFVNGTTVLLGDTLAYSYFQAHTSELGSSGVHPLQAGYNSLGGLWANSTRTALFSTVSGVTVSPSAPTVAGLATQAFAATVAGTDLPSQAVTWSKDSGVGSIDATTGVYTAPAATGSTQTAIIRATSVEDGSHSGTATITIPISGSPTVSGVSVSPPTATVTGLATRQFTATVAGTNNPSQSVTWSANAGSIDSSGLFTAPAATDSAQTITITATSVADNTKSGTATVTVPDAVALVYAPPAPTGDTVFSVAWLSPTTLSAFAVDVAEVGLSARCLAGRVLDAAGFTFEMCFRTSRTVSGATWLPVTIDPNTGVGTVAIPTTAGRYLRAWRVVNGAQVDGDWLPGVLTVQ